MDFLTQVSAGNQLWGTRGNNLYFKFEIIRFFKTKTRPQYRVSSDANTGVSRSLTLLLDVSVKLPSGIDFVPRYY